MLYNSEPSPVTNTVTLPVDGALTGAKQLSVGEDSDTSGATVQVDVVGYSTKNEVGGGFLSVRDTRCSTPVTVPARRSRPEGASPRRSPAASSRPAPSSISMDFIATNIAQPGGIIAVPGGTNASANPVMRFRSGGGIHSNLVISKIGTNGQASSRTPAPPRSTWSRGRSATPPARRGPAAVGGRSDARAGRAPSRRTARRRCSSDGVFTPASGVGGVFVNMNVWNTTGSGSLRVTPSGQTTVATSLMYWNGMTATYRHRRSGAVLTPGTDGKVVIENLGDKAITLEITKNAYFTVPTDRYATAGGAPALSVARTSAGPCYGYLEPSTSIVKTGCASGYETNDAQFATLSPAGHTFAGPVSVITQPGGRYVVTALHAPDGEVWTWELPYATTPPVVTAVRDFHHVKTPVVTASLPNGAPVGFTTDAEGRVWALDLDIQAPEQPRWKRWRSRRPSTDALTAVGTPAGIRLAATTASGDVVTGLYFGLTSTSLGWQSLGAAGARGKSRWPSTRQVRSA